MALRKMYYKVGEIKKITAVLTGKFGPIDLTGASNPQLTIKDIDNDMDILDVIPDITEDPQGGLISYTPTSQEANGLVPGIYALEWHVTTLDGQALVVPDDGYDSFIVHASLA